MKMKTMVAMATVLLGLSGCCQKIDVATVTDANAALYRGDSSNTIIAKSARGNVYGTITVQYFALGQMVDIYKCPLAEACFRVHAPGIYQQASSEAK